MHRMPWTEEAIGRRGPEQKSLTRYVYDGLSFEVLAEYGLNGGRAPQGKAWGWWENKPRPDVVSEFLNAHGRIVK